MSYQNILLETIQPGICQLTVNRPRSFNALNSATLKEIGAALEQVARDADARALIITGAGEKAFVAGADISEMEQMSVLQAQAFADLGQKTLRRLEAMKIPVIAAVNGYCLGGGCELALACDWIIASENAVFGQPEVNLGVIPGFGGSQRLPRRIGPGRAMELILSGRQIKADEALAWGLANHVYPLESLLDEARSIAEVIAGKGPVAVGLAKEAVRHGMDLDLDNGCLLERELFALCFSTEDQSEGMGAFLGKRAALFTGK